MTALPPPEPTPRDAFDTFLGANVPGLSDGAAREFRVIVFAFVMRRQQPTSAVDLYREPALDELIRRRLVRLDRRVRFQRWWCRSFDGRWHRWQEAQRVRDIHLTPRGWRIGALALGAEVAAHAAAGDGAEWLRACCLDHGCTGDPLPAVVRV